MHTHTHTHTRRYPVLSYPKGVSGASRDKERETPSIRVKLQHQVVSILPLKAYEDFIKVRQSVCLFIVCLSSVIYWLFICCLSSVCPSPITVYIYSSCFLCVILQFLKSDYNVVCEVLEPIISAKAKVSSRNYWGKIQSLASLFPPSLSPSFFSSFPL